MNMRVWDSASWLLEQPPRRLKFMRPRLPLFQTTTMKRAETPFTLDRHRAKTRKNKWPPPISTLPAKILIQILKHLHSPRDLHSYVLVSRHWCECAVELLWYKPSFPNYGTINKLATLLHRQNQTFTYFQLIRQLNLGADNLFPIFSRCGRLECLLTLFGCKQIYRRRFCPGPSTFRQSRCHWSYRGCWHHKRVHYWPCQCGYWAAGRLSKGPHQSHWWCSFSTFYIMSPSYCRSKSHGAPDRWCHLPRTGLSNALELDLSYCELITDASVRLIWTHLIHICELCLSHCSSLTNAAFPASVKPDVQPDVPNPFLTSTTTKNDDLSPFLSTTPLEDLRMLDLSACSLITDEAIKGIILHAPKIQGLDHFPHGIVFLKSYLYS